MRPERPGSPVARLGRALLAVVIGLALLAGCSSGGSRADQPGADRSAQASDSTPSGRSATGGSGAQGTTTPSSPYTGPDFYAPPDPLPKAPHGTLLRYQPVTAPAGAKAYRIMYLSESVTGEPIAVTGDAVVPDAPAPAGGRRVLTLAHGTTGIGDACAPSKHDGLGVEMSLVAPTVVPEGYLLVGTDYEGLGTPGVHPYLVGVSEGRGVIDAVPAASALPDAHAGKDIAIAGYSQGGHGALWANQVAARWAPDLHVVGTFAGAPATEIPLIANAAPTFAGAASFYVMMAAGYHRAYPQAKLDQVLTPAGIAKAEDDERYGCKDRPADAPAAPAGPQIKPDAGSVEPWAALYKENDPGQVKTADPILIIQSKQDNIVPVVLSQLLFTRLCGLGQVVERRVLDKGQGHVQAAPDAYREGLAWIDDRFAGRPAASTCPGAPTSS